MEGKTFWIAVLCVLIISSAGCMGLAGPSAEQSSDMTTMATSETTSQQSTATESNEQLAPGVTTEGVQDAELLADAHLATVENQSFVSRNRIQRTNESGTVYQNSTFSMVNESEWRYTVRHPDSPVNFGVQREDIDTYADGERVLAQHENESAVWYTMASVEGEQQSYANSLQKVFEKRQFPVLYYHDRVYSLASHADTVTKVGNDTVRLTGTTDESYIPVPTTSVSFSLTVSADGLVEQIRFTYDHADRPATYEKTITFTTNVKDPVEPPAWYGTALDETAVNATA